MPVINNVTQKMMKFPSYIFNKRKYKKDNDIIFEKRFFGGILKTQKRIAGFKLKLIGIPIFSCKDREYRTIKLFGIPIFVKERRSQFNKYLFDQIIEKSQKVYGKHVVADDVFIIRHNIGETILYLCELLEWAKRKNSERPLFIVWRERDFPLFKLFLGDDNRVVFIEIAQSDINCFLRQDLMLGSIRIHAPTFQIAESMKAKYISTQNINFADHILQSMHLEEWTNRRDPTPSARALNEAESLLQILHIKKPFVLLCPEAVSIKSLPDEFWLRIAESLTSSGYDVIINSYYEANNNSKFKAYHICCPDIDVLYALACKSKRIISMASGLGVLLSICDVPADLIYTDLKNKHIGYSADFCRQIYSVHSMPWNSTKVVMEHVATKNYDDLAKKILTRNI